MRANTHSDGLRGLVLAVLSSATFALSGPIAHALIEVGWTPGAAAMARIAGAFVVLLPATLVTLAGRHGLLRGHATRIVAFGVLGVTGAQLCFFNAVARMPVAVALLVEYVAPLAILAWLWALHGQRPSRLTLLGAACAIAGLAIVLGVFGGVTVSTAGLLWATGAMVGMAGYFLIAADDRSELPPIVLATAGLGVGGVALAALAIAGLQSVTVVSRDVVLAGTTITWWGAAAGLAAVTAAFPYLTGITAARILGARLMSFVALTEVLFAALFAWLLLDEGLGAAQVLGGLFVVAGIAIVRAAEPAAPGLGPSGSPELP